ncbi:MAG TPA: hypothetical protein VEY50_01510 [Lysobacter sp.]|nr:hypothetical protein [Lysobacter sp.]
MLLFLLARHALDAVPASAAADAGHVPAGAPPPEPDTCADDKGDGEARPS